MHFARLGTLDGFSFDSEDEIDNLPKAIAQTDENDAAEVQPVGKTKRAKKTSVCSPPLVIFNTHESLIDRNSVFRV